jgi:2-aminoadipate transaminase
MDAAGRFSRLSRRVRRDEIGESLKLSGQADLISFSGGWPHPDLFPVQELQEICRDLLRDSAASCLQYCPAEGSTELRGELLRLTAGLGLQARDEELLVTSGSQQALDLLARVFLDPGDLVVTENPSFVSAIVAFRAAGARFLPVAMDDEGLRPEELAAALAGLAKAGGGAGLRGRRLPKFLYTIPDFQNPTGITLAAERRARLLELAERFDLLIVEDVPYRWLRFRGEQPPLLGAADRSGRVLSVFSFSKIIAPGLRVAWVVGHGSIIARLVQAKQAADLCTSSFNQAMAGEFLRRGLLEPAVQRSTDRYRRNLGALQEALREHLSALPGVSWVEPQGGIFLWLTLPPAVDCGELLAEAVRQGVAFVPGSCFFPDGGGGNTLRLSFSYVCGPAIREGVRRLAQVIRGRGG